MYMHKLVQQSVIQLGQNFIFVVHHLLHHQVFTHSLVLLVLNIVETSHKLLSHCLFPSDLESWAQGYQIFTFSRSFAYKLSKPADGFFVLVIRNQDSQMFKDNLFDPKSQLPRVFTVSIDELLKKREKPWYFTRTEFRNCDCYRLNLALYEYFLEERSILGKNRLLNHSTKRLNIALRLWSLLGESFGARMRRVFLNIGLVLMHWSIDDNTLIFNWFHWCWTVDD